MNRDRLLADAKAHALQLAPGYTPAQPRAAIRVGGESLLAALKLGVHLAWRAGRISDHDALIGRKLAWILAGGNLAASGDADRAATAGSRARGVSEPVRREEDAGADRSHAEDRKAVAQLKSKDRVKIFDEGSGPPIVVIPGVQGRWEWMRPALRALATHCRVISYSLATRARRRSTAGFDSSCAAGRRAGPARRRRRRRSAGCRSAGWSRRSTRRSGPSEPRR